MSVQRFFVSKEISNPDKNLSKINASGGAISYAGPYKIHIFTNTSNFVLSNIGSSFLEALLVGGGGGSGTYSGGGGGGEVVWISMMKPFANTYPVVVGLGGTGNTANDWQSIKDGQQSTAFGEYALGGGGAKGSDSATPANNGTVTNVANGGGGSSRSAGYFGTQGTFSNYSGARYGGNRGGQISFGGGSPNGDPNYPGGGGGGAGASVSVNSGGTNATAGGVGVQNSITGSSLHWGGGGGGGTYYAGLGGAGGNGGGGGGAGGGGGGSGGAGYSNGQSAGTGAGGNGGANTGGGGGGGRGETSQSGGSGGSGIVVIRYLI